MSAASERVRRGWLNRRGGCPGDCADCGKWIPFRYSVEGSGCVYCIECAWERSELSAAVPESSE